MIELIKTIRKKGFKNLEYSWVDEDNLASRHLAEHLQGQLYKKYRVYERDINN